MGKSAGSQQVVNEYYLSLHLGFSHSVDEVVALGIGDREFWHGSETDQAALTIQSRDLFGGPTKEGGVGGVVHVLQGRSDQVLPDELARRLGRASGADCPAFRGKLTMFFVNGLTGLTQGQIGTFGTYFGAVFNGLFGTGGGGTNSLPGFYVGANNPYLKNIWARVRRASVGLNPATAKIPRAGSTDGAWDLNPAHMIYELCTNTTWGMGESPAAIDTANFNAVASQLYAEGLGLTVYWNRQSTIEDFVQDIINHIDAAIYVDPRTGLRTIKLARADYDIGSLTEINADNAKLISFDRTGEGEQINEITVSYTDPITQKPSTVTLQNLAGIETQGEIISDSRNYHMFRSLDVATQACNRDLRTASTPLAVGSLELDRTFWDITPGRVYKLNFPERGFTSLIARAGAIDYGTGGGPIRASFVEDAYGYTAAQFTAAPTSQWVSNTAAPAPIQFQRVITLPAYMTMRQLDTTTAGTFEYPETLAGVMGSTAGEDTSSYEVYTQVIQPDGSQPWASVRFVNNLGRATLVGSLTAQASSVCNFENLTGIIGPNLAGFAMIGGDTADDADTEICLVTDLDGTDVTLARGCLDTVPRDWPAGTPVWFFTADTNFSDSQVRAVGEDPDYKILTRTGRGLLDQADAVLLSDTLTDRPWRPNRPGNVKVEGVGFSPGGATIDTSGVGGTTLAVTWANRNRVLEETQVVRWADATITPESGQTTTIRVMKTDRTVLATHTGLTGASYALPKTDFGSEAVGIVRVTAVRDGFESLTGHELWVRRSFPSKIKLSGDMATGFEKLSGDMTAGSDKLLQSGS